LENTRTIKGSKLNSLHSVVLLYLLLSCFSVGNSFAQNLPYDIVNWNSNNALPQNSCYDLEHDSKGNVWLATYGGLVKYDGHNFKTYNSNTTPEVTVNRLLYIAINQKDEVFALSSEGGLIYSKNDTFMVIPYINSNDFPYGLAIDSLGKPIIMLRTGVYTLDGFNVVKHPFFHPENDEIPLLTARMHYVERDTAIYICHSDGYSVLKQNTIYPNSYYSGSGYVKGVHHKGDTLFIHSEKSTDVWLGSSIIKSFENDGDQMIVAMFSDHPNGDIVEVSHNHIRFIHPDLTHEDFVYPASTPVSLIHTMSIDRESNIWLGSVENGLTKLTKKLFTVISDHDAPSFNVQGLHPDGDLIWFGLNCGGICNYNHQTGHLESPRLLNDKKRGGCVTSIEKDSNGIIWFGSHGDGLRAITPDNKDIVLTEEDGLKKPTVLGLLAYNQDELLVGFTSGLQYYNTKTNTFRSPQLTPELDKATINIFFIDSKDRIWLGTYSGVFIIDGEEITHLTKKDGIPHHNCRSFYEDEEGAIWIGTYGGGLARYKDEKIQTIGTQDGLWNSIVSTIVRDGDILWMTCNEGLFGASITELRSFLDGNTQQIHCLNFGTEAGLTRNEFNGGFQPSGFMAEDGKLYFSSIDGLVIFDPSQLPSIPSPSIFVSDIIIDGTSKSIYEPLILYPDDKRVSFVVSCPSYAYPKNNIRLYRLKGYDEEWKKLNSEGVIDYTNLTSGEYELELKTRSLLAAQKQEVISSLSFTVKAPWFLNPRTIAFTSLAIIVLLVLSIVIIQAESKRRKKRFQEALDIRTKELIESEHRLSTLIENTDTLIWSIDMDYKLLSYNKLFEDFAYAHLHFKPSLGLNLINAAKPVTQEFWLKYFRKVEQGKSVRVEVEYTTPKDEEIVFETSLFPIKDEFNSVIGIVGFSKDKTDIVKREHELEEARRIAEKAANVKSDFLATMSHEIRTPLNGVIGTTSLLLTENLTQQQEELVKTIRISSETLMNIINEILDFSKLESGKTALETTRFHLLHTLEETVSLVKNRANEKGISISISVEEQVPELVKGDITRLRQILLNLLHNAVKFTESGRIDLHVKTLQVEQKSVELEFSVTDTGIGIPEARVKELFKPFNQLDNSTTRKFGGTGLGLSISKKLVELMGGNIWVESSNGKGTTFYFTVKLDTLKELPYVTDKLPERPKGLNHIGIVSKNRELLEQELEKDLIQWGCSVKKYHPEQIINDIKNVDFIIMCQPNEEIHKLNIPYCVIPAIQHEIQLSSSSIIGHIVKEFEQKQKTVIDPKKTHILVAEDNLVNQKIASMLLGKLGYQADLAANGLEAIDALTRQKYDMILMDMQMPELDGLEATKRIRSDFPRGEQPIIVAVTANAMSGDKEKCLAAGMDDYLSKPVTLQSLENCLTKWL